MDHQSGYEAVIEDETGISGAVCGDAGAHGATTGYTEVRSCNGQTQITSAVMSSMRLLELDGPPVVRCLVCKHRYVDWYVPILRIDALTGTDTSDSPQPNRSGLDPTGEHAPAHLSGTI